MKKMLAVFVLFAFATLSYGANNASPFGLEIGRATLPGVQKYAEENKATLSQKGQNQYSGGKMFETASNFDVEGVKRVLFIFSPTDVLVGVMLTMDKDPVSLSKSFAKKYKVVASHIDTFMNYGTAQYKQGDSVIVINSEHLRYEMTVIYSTKTLYDSFKATVGTEKATKKSKKESRL